MQTTDHITFTVVIPILNAAATAESVLQSLAAQSYRNFEVLIRDGGSTDGTLTLIKKYSNNDPRFQCVSEKDNGIYDAMNKAIIKAKGDWLFFLGSDDFLYDDQVFADVANAIGKNPDARLVYGNVQLNRPLGYHHQELIYAGKFDENKLLTKNICHQSAFYHRSLFEEFGLFRTEYAIFADYDFNLRCFNKIKSHYLERVIANFNVGGHSKTQQHLDRLFEHDFLENMATDYSFSYKSSFFNGHKKELFTILRNRLRHRHFGDTLKIARILSYQTLKRNRS